MALRLPLRLGKWFFAAPAALLLAGCPAPAPSDRPAGSTAGQPIKLGHYGSLTGDEATFGQSTDKGAQLAVAEINAAGGLLGRPVVLQTEDTQSRGGMSATVVQKLLRDGAVSIIGEVASGRSLEAAPILQRAKVPMVSPSSTNPDVTKVGDYIFRVCFIDPFQGQVMANFARDRLKLSRVAVLHDAAAPYSVGLADFFKRTFIERGGAIVVERTYEGGQKDFRPQLTAIAAAKPDGLFVPGYYEAAAGILVQARELGLNIPVFGGDGWESPRLVEVAGKAAEGTYYSTHFSPESTDPRAQEFVAKFRAKWNETPDAMAALGYDAVKVIAAAIVRAGSAEPAAIRDALAQTKDFVGATGRTSLDAERNAVKPAVVIAVRNGQFVFDQTVEP